MPEKEIYAELNKLLQTDEEKFEVQLNKFLQTFPDNEVVQGYRLYYEAAFRSTQFDVKSLLNIPENEFSLLAMAVMHIQSEEYGQAIQKLERARDLDLAGRNMWILFELYRAYIGLGKEYLAWKYLEESIEIDHEFYPSRIEKSFNLDQGINCEEIINLLSPVVQEIEDAEIYGYYASALNNCGNTNDAISYLQKAVELRKDFAEAYRLLGDIYHYQKVDLERSLKNYQICLVLDSTDVECVLALAWLHFTMNEPDLAEQMFHTLLTINADHEAYAQVIQFYIQSDQLRKAESFNDKDRSENSNSFYNDGFDILLTIKNDEFNKSHLSNLTSKYLATYGEAEKLWLESAIRDM